MKPWIDFYKLETDAAWLAGIIEGEGTLFYYMGGANKSVPVFRIYLVNSSLDMLKKAARIMADWCDHDILIKEKHYNAETAKIKSTAPMYMIEVCRQQDVLEVLMNITQFMAAKRNRATAIAEILWNHKRGAKWTKGELREISQRLVETECQAPEMPIRVKRQSELAGNCKSAAEMTASRAYRECTSGPPPRGSNYSTVISRRY